MSEHTPAPWQVHSDHEALLVIGNIDGPDEGRFTYTPVCNTDSDDANPPGLDAANAAHIVRCVNNHAQLLKLAKTITLTYGDIHPLGKMARAAIAKVEQ